MKSQASLAARNCRLQEWSKMVHSKSTGCQTVRPAKGVQSSGWKSRQISY